MHKDTKEMKELADNLSIWRLRQENCEFKASLC
jgi:hypothetical protein